MIKQYYKSIGVKKRKQDVIAFDVTRDVGDTWRYLRNNSWQA